MKRIFSLAKNELVTGLLLLAPIAGATWLVYELVTSVDGLFPDAWRPLWPGHHRLPGLGLLAVFLGALMLGLFAHNFVGRRVVHSVDALVQRIPLFGGTYGLIKQVLEAVFAQSGSSFKSAVLVEYPSPGSWAIGFVTQPHAAEALGEAAGVEVISVFVPTCPNPTSGFYLVVEKSRVRELHMPVQQAFKLVLTMGIADAESEHEAITTTAKWTRPGMGAAKK